MNRGDSTTVKELKTGDRFYKMSDKHKLPFELINTHSKFEICEARFIKNGSAPISRLRGINGSIKVVFLRNVNQSN